MGGKETEQGVDVFFADFSEHPAYGLSHQVVGMGDEFRGGSGGHGCVAMFHHRIEHRDHGDTLTPQIAGGYEPVDLAGAASGGDFSA